jgi:sodium-coupled neutral amino acid transporter 11
MTGGGGDGKEKVSVANVALNMSNAIIGAGIVGLPYALKEAGCGLGLMLLVAMAWVTNYSIGCLIASAARVRATSYDALARDALGGAGEIAVIFGQFVFDYGAALSYLIILGDTSESVVEFALKRHAPGSRELCIAVASLFMLPLCLLRDIAKLEACAFLSIVSVSVVTVVIIAKLALRNSAPSGALKFANGGDPLGCFQALGIFSFAFVCQDSVFLFYNTLRDNTVDRFKRVSALALGASALYTVVIAAAGFVAFRDGTEANILNNYDVRDYAAVVMRVFYAATMMCTYPTCVFVCRQAGHALLRSREAYAGRDPDVLERDVADVSSKRHAAYSVSLWLTTVVISLLTKKLGVVMSLTGNVAGSLLGFVLPGLIALKVLALDTRASINDDEDLVEGLLESSVAEKPPSKWPYVGLVVFGGFTGVLGVATTFTSA